MFSRFMTLAAILIAVLACHVPAFADAPTGPSFDCKIARTPMEHLICSDARLAKSDLQLSQTFRQLHQSAGADWPEILTEQREWLTSVRVLCAIPSAWPVPNAGQDGLIDCLRWNYEQRVADLQESVLLQKLPPRPHDSQTGWSVAISDHTHPCPSMGGLDETVSDERRIVWISSPYDDGGSLVAATLIGSPADSPYVIVKTETSNGHSAVYYSAYSTAALSDWQKSIIGKQVPQNLTPGPSDIDQEGTTYELVRTKAGLYEVEYDVAQNDNGQQKQPTWTYGWLGGDFLKHPDWGNVMQVCSATQSVQ